MMMRMGTPPVEEGSEGEKPQKYAHRIIQRARVKERSVSTIVLKYEHPGKHTDPEKCEKESYPVRTLQAEQHEIPVTGEHGACRR